MTNRKYVKYLRSAKQGIQNFLLEEQTTQQQKDEIINELSRLNGQIEKFKSRRPDEKANTINLEFKSKIEGLWIPPKKNERLLSNSLSKEEITGLGQ